MNIQNRDNTPKVKTTHIVTFAFCTAVMAILCTAAGFLFAVIPGLPLGFCPAVPLMAPFALWFGGWGVAAAYSGAGSNGPWKWLAFLDTRISTLWPFPADRSRGLRWHPYLPFDLT